MATLNVAPALSAYDLRDGRLVEGKSFREVFVSLAASRTAANIYNFLNGELGVRKRGPTRYAPASHHVSFVVGVASYAKVFDVAAQRIIARMKKVSAIGDFAVCHSPDKPVSFPNTRTHAVNLPDIYQAVACCCARPNPLHTSAIALFQASLQKAGEGAVFLLSHHLRDYRAALYARLFHSPMIMQGLPHGN